MKKATIKKADSIKMTPLKITSDIGKANDFEVGFIYPVINTTRYLDSHNDVHIDGIWNKSVSEQFGKLYYVADHKLEVTSIIAHKQDVQPMLISLSWSSLGADYAGDTQALVYKIAEKDIVLPAAKEIIEGRKDIENSVRMEYVKFSLAVSSADADFTEENDTFNKFIGSIANKEQAIENGYFWAIEEAKIYKEGSMVLAGSNDVTPIQYANTSTQIDEPLKDTQEDEPQNIEEDKKQFYLKTLKH
ncbi:MAG: hypothetical protein QNK20_16590 [Aureibaculum sp.]|nr:hypothetical protein [Aureibaculum sp.]